MEFLNLNDAAAVAEYEAFNRTCPKGHFAQSVGWGKLKSEWIFEGIVSRDRQGKINGIMSVLVRKMPMMPTSLLYSPRGPVCDVHDKVVLATLMEGARILAKKHKAYALKMDSDVRSDDKEYLDIMLSLGCKMPKETEGFEGIQPAHVMRMFLNGRSAQELLMSFSEGHRRKTRKAAKAGVAIKRYNIDMVPHTVEFEGLLSPKDLKAATPGAENITDENPLGTFYNIMLETGVRDNFVIRKEAYFRKLMECLGEDARLYMAYAPDGRPIAGTLAIGYGNKVWYLYGASSNSRRELNPNYLLQYAMMNWAVERGADIYDFRGIPGQVDKEHHLYGLVQFKSGFFKTDEDKAQARTEFCGELSVLYNGFWRFAAESGQRAYRKIHHILFTLKNRK